MSSDGPSSHSGSQGQSANPYAAGDLPASRESPPLSENQSELRDYRLRMSWADRRRLLRAAFPYRLAAVCGVVIGGYALYSLFSGLFESWRMAEFSNSQSAMYGIRIAFVVFKSVLAIGLCVFYWKLAEAMARTAGGTTGNLHEWSLVQSRIAWIVVASVAMALASEGWGWIEIFLIERGFISNDF